MKSPSLKYLPVILSIVLLASCGSVVRTASNSPTIAGTAQFSIGEGFANKFFYQPKKNYPHTPTSYGFKFQNVTIPSTNNTKLHGWMIPAQGKTNTQKPRFTFVYHHGNFGTMGHHVNRVKWLIEEGHNVLMYDYRGYGKSTGRISTSGLIQDAHHAIKFAAMAQTFKGTKIISYGHSLGGAKSTVALSLYPQTKRLVLALNESSFASYKDMATKFGGLVGKGLANDAYAPVFHIKKANVPIILIHGTADNLIPVEQARKLYIEAKSSSLKAYWEVPGGNHYNCLSMNKGLLKNELRKILKSL